MNLDRFAVASDGEVHMRFDARQLMTDSLAILRRFDWRALVIAIVSTAVFFFVLKLHPLLSLVLGLAVYAGVALLWQRPAPAEIPPEPSTLEEEAFDRMRGSTTRVLAEAEKIEKPEIRERVCAIGQTFGTMLDVMEEDKERKQLAAAPDYEVVVVGPFEQKLDYYVYLSQRRVALAAPQLARFEQNELRRYEVLTNSFYQHYHDDAVIDFAALLEIFEEDEDFDEENDDLGDSLDGDDDEERDL